MQNQKAKMLVSFWLLNALLIYIVYVAAPGYIVIGNANLNPLAAVLLNGALLLVVNKVVMGLVKEYLKEVKESFAMMFGLMTLVDVAAVWALARMAVYTGLGLASFWVSIGLGVLISGGNGLVWKYMPAKKTVRAVHKKVHKKSRR